MKEGMNKWAIFPILGDGMEVKEWNSEKMKMNEYEMNVNELNDEWRNEGMNE